MDRRSLRRRDEDQLRAQERVGRMLVHADVSQQAIQHVSDEVISFVDSNKDSGVDRKWIVENAGNYTITVNQLAETITIVKN